MGEAPRGARGSTGTGRPHGPDRILPWLARVVGARGPLDCREVRCERDGTLAFALSAPGAPLVRWRVAAPRPGETRYRDGSIAVSGDHGPTGPVAATALEQVTGALELVLARRRLELLDRRNRELGEVSFGAHFVPSVFGELLRPGETRCGPWLFGSTVAEDGGVALRFQRRDEVLELRVQAADRPVEGGRTVGAYGPLALVAPEAVERRHEAARVVELVGYLLAISVPPGVVLVEPPGDAGAEESAPPADEQGPRVDPRQPLNDKANPFFHDAFNTAALQHAAVAASRGRVVTVMHSDRECVGFTSYLDGPVETAQPSRLEVRPTPDFVRRLRLVDISELDAILTGGEERLAALTREEVGGARKPELLVVLGTCVSRILGDDVERAVRDAGALDAGVPTIWLEATASEDQQARSLWARIFELFESPRTPDDGPAVNLLGYGSWRNEDHEELERLLASVGVRRNASLIPTFDLAELRHLGDADVNLVLPAQHVRDSLAWVGDKASAPLFEPPPPFGIAGTRAWIDATLRFLGRAPVTEAWMERQLEPLRPRWERLVRAAGELRVALVLTSDHFGSVAPFLRGGVPWLSVLREMGFGLDVFVIPAPGREVDARRRAEALATTRRLLEVGDRHTVTWAGSMGELRERLLRAGCHLCYTEVGRDRRVLSVGAVPFDYTVFDMGFVGACRTLERLVQRGRTPFYRRYGSRIPCPEWNA